MMRNAAILLAACLILPSCAGESAQPSDRMVSVGTHSLQIHREGKGKPTIVIDAGITDQLDKLRPLQGRLAQETSVVTYNRAGYAQSEPGPLPRDCGREADELKTLLDRASVAGPYVLVGHSLGALNVMMFASKYPEDVAGMVLLDPPPLSFILGQDYKELGAMAERMTAEWQAIADSTAASTAPEDKARSAFFRMIASEHREMFGESAKLAGAIATFGDIPLVVLAAGKANPAFGPIAEEYQKYWIEQSRALAGKSTRAKFAIVKDSSHYLYLDAPELVAESILSVVSGARAQKASERDVFAFVRALDEAGARNVWPGFKPSEWPVAFFDGEQTILLRHPSPPPEFASMPGRSGVFAMPGRHPDVVGNSTRKIGGVRTATVIAKPEQKVESTMLGCVEEVFHVFWLERHPNFRPNEMLRYSYPVKDRRNLELILAEDEALARALEENDPARAAGWAVEVIRIRGERLPLISDGDRAFETGLEMMEGTANCVARVAVGEKPEATSVRLRAERKADEIRWRFYESGAAICLLLDRFQPDWKSRIDGDIELTTAELLETAVARAEARPAAFTAAELARFEERAASAIAELSERQRAAREDLFGRTGPRIVVEAAGESAPLQLGRFDPINLFVLDGGEVIHPHYIAFTCPNGTIELSNPGYARDSFAGTVALTSAAGRHPLGEGIRSLTVFGLKDTPRVDRRDGQLIIEAEGVKITLQGADARTDGETLRIILPAPAGDSPDR